MLALVLAVDGSAIGVLAVPVVAVLVYAALKTSWRQADRVQAARNKEIATRVLERAFQNPDEPLDPARLARQLHLTEVKVRLICEQLITDGYVHRKPKKKNRLYLSPAGLEAMRYRKERGT